LSQRGLSPILSAWKTRGEFTSRHAQSLIAVTMVFGLVHTLCGSTSTTTLDPNKAEVVTADVVHFWRAFDESGKVPTERRGDVYRREYFDLGSQGLKDYAAFRRVTAETLAAHVEQNRDAYATIRPFINEVVKQKPVIQAAFRRLKALYPDMKFPAHVYLVVGPQKGAGMNSDNGIILAADMFATPPGTPYSYTRVSAAYVPYAAVHETIHFNQAYQTNDQSTLLQNVVSEGTADFIASLVLQEPAVRQHTDRWHYGCGNETELAARLLREADLKITKPWLFDHAPDTGWPPDMGYWIGYRISQAYYDRANDKRAALRDMLGVTDFKAYLEASGYPGSRTSCVPETSVRGDTREILSYEKQR
jgi:hypothetical protein